MKHKVLIISVFVIIIIVLHRMVQFQTSVVYTKIESESTNLVSWLETIKYADNDVYASLKEAYDNIDFYGEFKTGDLEKYPFYKEQFSRLIREEEIIIDKETGKEYDDPYGASEEQYKGNYEISYYFFDMDGDNNPELCVTDNERFRHVIKYDQKLDQFTMWNAFGSTSFVISGTKKIRFSANARYSLSEMNEDGTTEFEVWFRAEGYYDSVTQEPTYCYLVTFPRYYGENSKNLPEYLKEQCVMFHHDENIYFRLTEDQFYGFFDRFLLASKIAYNKIEETRILFDESTGQFQ